MSTEQQGIRRGLAHAMAAMARAARGGTTREEEGCLLYSCGTSTPVLWNGVFRTDPAADPRRIVPAVEAFFRERRSGYTWQIRGDEDRDLMAALEGAGPAFVEAPELTLGAEEGCAPETGPGVELRSVDSERALDAWLDVMVRGFATLSGGAIEDIATDWQHAYPALPSVAGPDRHTVLAVRDGVPVAGGIAYTTPPHTEIVHVATVPEARRSGLGAAVTWALVEASRQAGATRVTLQASPAGAPVYRRLGFHESATRRWFVRRAESSETDGRVRPARPSEAQALSELGTRSKAYWGYPADWMATFRDELRVAPEEIEDHPVEVFEDPRTGRLLGYVYVERLSAEEAELERLFVSPDAIGSGVGARLFRRGLELARELGVDRMRIMADPAARRFYERMGARAVDEIPSSIPGRSLPLFHIQVDR